jgi:hypothetical protein
MRCMIIFIEVEESRLHKVEGGRMWLLKNSSKSYNYQTNNTSILTQPIKPVLVGEGEVKDGDYVVANYDFNNRCILKVTRRTGLYSTLEGGYELMTNRCKLILTQDTESLYPQIASGELVEGGEYEFEEELDCESQSLCSKFKLSTPLKVVGEVDYDILKVATKQIEGSDYKPIRMAIEVDSSQLLTKEGIIEDLQELFDGGDCCFSFVTIENCLIAMDKWANQTTSTASQIEPNGVSEEDWKSQEGIMTAAYSALEEVKEKGEVIDLMSFDIGAKWAIERMNNTTSEIPNDLNKSE